MRFYLKWLKILVVCEVFHEQHLKKVAEISISNTNFTLESLMHLVLSVFAGHNQNLNTCSEIIAGAAAT